MSLIKRIISETYQAYLSKKHSIPKGNGLQLLSSVFINDYKNNIGKIPSVYQAHKNRFSYNDWCLLKAKANNYNDYLNTIDYCSLHPFNGSESSWIDDKLTLKYIINGTSLSDIMPEYYFQINDAEHILPLLDYSDNNNDDITINDVINLLIQKKKLAFKKIAASMGAGFIKAEYKDCLNPEFYLNEKPCSRDEIIITLTNMKGYLVMELLEPNQYFAKFSNNSIGCLRYQIGRNASGEVEELFAYMRIGTQKSGSVENYDAGGILTYIHNGVFNGGHMLDKDTKVDRYIERHPDNDIEIKGTFPMWDQIKAVAFEIAKLMPQLNYIGIDFCLTNNNMIKVLEINSLTSLIGFQLETPIFKTPIGNFFRERLRLNNSL